MEALAERGDQALFARGSGIKIERRLKDTDEDRRKQIEKRWSDTSGPPNHVQEELLHRELPGF